MKKRKLEMAEFVNLMKRGKTNNICKKNNGITLIALIVTVLITIILMGIVITSVTNGGLFKNAREAAKNVEVSETKRKIQEELTAKTIEKMLGVLEKKDIKEILEKHTSEYVVPQMQNGTIKFAENRRSI